MFLKKNENICALQYSVGGKKFVSGLCCGLTISVMRKVIKWVIAHLHSHPQYLIIVLALNQFYLKQCVCRSPHHKVREASSLVQDSSERRSERRRADPSALGRSSGVNI